MDGWMGDGRMFMAVIDGRSPMCLLASKPCISYTSLLSFLFISLCPLIIS